MRSLAVLAGALLVASVVHAATPLRVEQDDSIRGLHAERRALDVRFDVVATASGRAATSSPAVGTAQAPAEIGEADTPASTSVEAGHWTFTATIREREPDSIARGRFVAQLTLDAASVGEVHLGQDIANPAVREGARITFDIGPQPPDGPLFVIVVKQILPAHVAHDLRSAIGPDLQYRWEGDGGTNPTLSARAGAPVSITITNDDGTSPHNLRILDGGSVVAGPTDDVDERGDQETLVWTPPRATTYRYDCAYHPTMIGDLEVTP